MSFKQGLIRSLLGLMRSIAPVIHFKNDVFVFRYADVVEVLRRDQDFTIAPINKVNIERHLGDFLLGMDAGAQLEHEQKAMRAVVDRADQARIRNFVREMSQQLIEEAQQKGKFDIVRDFTRLVPLRMIADYFGTPGNNEDEMLRWNRLIFWDIFLNFKDDQVWRKEALAASANLNKYLLDLMAARKSVLAIGGRLPNDLISRLVSNQQGDGPYLDDDGIRRNVAGALLGAEEPISKVCIHVLEILLAKPKAMKLAKEAAARDDVEAVSRITFDALRYNPSNPVILRHSEKEVKIGPEGGKKRKIKSGKKVYAVTYSAMFDKRMFQNPKEIRDDRPLEHLLHFGYGLHTCYGSYVNFVAIPEMMMALLKLDIAPVGELSKEAGFPDHWEWKFV